MNSYNAVYGNSDLYCRNILQMSPLIYLFLLELLFNVCKSISTSEINRHLELGRDFLARGQLSDALNHYHAAVEGDPNNYLTYFKRGTVYLALGKAKNALADLDRVLELKPDFHAARISRGSIHLKQADFDLAQLDFHNVIKFDSYNPEANELIQRIQPARDTLHYAHLEYNNGNYGNAIHYLTTVLEFCPWAHEVRQLRAESHIKNNDILSAISDIRSATRLQTDYTQGYYRLSTLLYELGHASDALKEIRECLKLDPEHKHCFPFYKKIRKVEKFMSQAEENLESSNYQDCIENANRVLKHEENMPMIVFNAKQLLCTCYMKDEQTTEAISACRDALDISQDTTVYCNRAEAYLQAEMYDDAIRDYKSALEIDRNFDKAKEGLAKAQKMQQQSEKRDYYKILGVKRTATKREITKAYRKMAQKWHPDNFQNNESEKKIAEKKFIDIAAAKEVLTDDEKRAQFDSGVDPLDPESGRHQGGNPFEHFHHFQHGSPFQFKFHFN